MEIAVHRNGSARRSRACAALVAVAAAVASGPAGAASEASVEATYYATLGGFSIASGNLTFMLGDSGEYRAALGAQVSGFAALIANRSAEASASGRAIPGSPSSRSYSMAINGGPIANEVNMTFSGGSVASVRATELRSSNPDARMPVTAAHKQGVIDPLAAFVVTMGNPKDVLTPKVCNRTLRVFDGRVRYDLRLVYGAKTDIQGQPGSYSGPAIICAVNYRPIAGFRPLTPEQEKYERNIEFSITFVPVGTTGVMLPYRVNIGTPAGLLVVSASRFEVKGTRLGSTGSQGETAAAAPEAVASGAPLLRNNDNR